MTGSTAGQFQGFAYSSVIQLLCTWLEFHPRTAATATPPDSLPSLNGANCLFISQIGWCFLISKFSFSKSRSLKPHFILPTLGNVTGTLTTDSFECFVGLRKSGQLLGTNNDRHVFQNVKITRKNCWGFFDNCCRGSPSCLL